MNTGLKLVDTRRGRIDEILSWEKTKEQEKDVSALWSWESISARFAPSSIGD